MATGALDANGIWQYGEDDSNTTFSALLNRLGTSIGSNMKGRILQTVVGYTSTQVLNSTTSFVSTGLSATITPIKSNSKILIFTQLQIGRDTGGDINNGVNVHLRRGSTPIYVLQNNIYTAGNSLYYLNLSVSPIWEDSPGTTSATTYGMYFANSAGSATSRVNFNDTNSRILLVEVSA